MKRPLDANERFEIIGQLYWLDTGFLRPGKDAPTVAGYEPLSDENWKRFHIWAKDRLTESALEQIANLQRAIEILQEECE